MACACQRERLVVASFIATIFGSLLVRLLLSAWAEKEVEQKEKKIRKRGKIARKKGEIVGKVDALSVFS